MKRILCFGDSNTWGYIPGVGTRYDEDVRWTGVCQRLLGEDYTILEDGQGGRTTVYDTPWNPYLNGKTALPYSLLSQKPLDLVIILLGTNDMRFANAVNVAKGADELVRICLNAGTIFSPASPVFRDEPRVLLVSPIHMGEAARELFSGEFLPDAVEQTHRLADEYTKVAARRGVFFLDAARYAEPSKTDGLHMLPEGHARLGAAMSEKIREILGQ